MDLAVQKALTIHKHFNSYTSAKKYFLSLPLNDPDYMQAHERVLKLKEIYNNSKL